MPLLSRRATSAAQGFGLNSSGKVHFSPVTYSTAGTYTFRVPVGNNSVVLTYPTVTGMTSTTVAVTQNTDVTVTIGNYAVASSFGATTIPAYTKTVLNHTSGNIDNTLSQTFAVATTSVITATSSGTNGTVSAAINAAGIYFNYDGEGNQGDFSETITVSTVPIATLVGTFRAVGNVTSSRGESTCTITTQPTSANSYRASHTTTEFGYSNYPVLFNVALQQVGYLQISEAA
jgi:hypothetical protein